MIKAIPSFRKLIFYVLPVLAIACGSFKKPLPQDFELTTAWANMALDITKNTPANSPTFASRCFGYIGLTMYETVVYADSSYQSVAPQLNGLGALPAPEKNAAYNWQVALNAGQAEIIRSLYIQTTDDNKRKIDSLEQHFREIYASQVQNDSVIARSVAYGKQIAQRIFEWSKTDGGHRGYLANFDKTFVFAERPGCWRPPLYAQSFSHYPLHPHWGNNRTFLPADSAMTPPEFIAYDTTPGSPYYNQFKRVYEKRKVLSQQEKEAAIWWSDDVDVTFTPPGHTYYMAVIAVKKARPGLLVCAQTFAQVGMAVADAYRNCWKWKYIFYTERPNTFVQQHIDQRWESFWPDPPFPAFPSGHAINGGAAATVLTGLYGDHFAFIDSAHYGRPKDEIRNTNFVCRHFNSFWQAAREIADSRFYGGIHTPQDNQKGLEKGAEVARNVMSLKWRK